MCVRGAGVELLRMGRPDYTQWWMDSAEARLKGTLAGTHEPLIVTPYREGQFHQNSARTNSHGSLGPMRATHLESTDLEYVFFR